MLKQKIGRKAMVGHGNDGPPGVLLALGKSIKIEVSGGKSNVVRVIAMTAPTKVPDNYVSVREVFDPPPCHSKPDDVCDKNVSFIYPSI
jgi:hypothetical protein